MTEILRPQIQYVAKNPGTENAAQDVALHA